MGSAGFRVGSVEGGFLEAFGVKQVELDETGAGIIVSFAKRSGMKVRIDPRLRGSAKGEVLVRMEHLGLGNDPEMPAALAWSPEFHASGEVLVEAVQYPRVDPLTVAVEASEGDRHSITITSTGVLPLIRLGGVSSSYPSGHCPDL